MRIEGSLLTSLGLALLLTACATLAQADQAFPAMATKGLAAPQVVSPVAAVSAAPQALTPAAIALAAPQPLTPAATAPALPQALTPAALALVAPPQPLIPAKAAPASPQLLGAALNVTLKDGQHADLNLVNYDRFFLSVVNTQGTHFDIPWTEVAAVDGPIPGDLALMRGNITSDSGPVLSVIQYRSPSEALRRALWPGILIHGSGLRYAGDNSSFVGLAGGEFFGVVLGAFGAYLGAFPNTGDNSLAGSQALVSAGVACFAVTWIWDLVFAGHSAQALDNKRGLAFEPAAKGDGVQLSYHY